MPFDRAAALALAESAAAAFAEGLQGLVAAAEAELAAARKILDDEANSLAQREECLEAARAQLEGERSEVAEFQEALQGEAAQLTEASSRLRSDEAALAVARSRFEEERRSWGQETVHFNVSGAAQISTLRSTLVQCEDSVLAAALSGRWSVEKDEDGRIFVDFPPKLFVSLVEYMQNRSIEDPEAPTPTPVFEAPEVEAQFQRMLQYYGLLEWVYRPDPVDFSVILGRHCYAVLPPRSPDEATAGRDMQDRVLEVPRGWEVLSSEAEGFEATIVELTARCWGTHLLCVENSQGGFDSYRTAVRTVGGPPGSIFQADIDWLEKVEGDSHVRFRFRGLSGRLVVRAKHEALALAMARGDAIVCGPAAR